MKNILFIVCALALFSASFVSAAHVHFEKQIPIDHSQKVELSVDQGNTDSGDSSDLLCDVHCHNHMAPMNFTQKALPKAEGERLFIRSENTISFFIYGLKRPPRI